MAMIRSRSAGRRRKIDEPGKKNDPARESEAGSPLSKTDPSRLKAHTPQPTTRTFTPPARTHPASTPGHRSLPPPSWRPAFHSKSQFGRMYQMQKMTIHGECAALDAKVANRCNARRGMASTLAAHGKGGL